MLLESGVSPLYHPSLNPTDFQTGYSGLSSWCWTSSLRFLVCGLNLWLPKEDQVWDIPFFFYAPASGVGPNHIASPPFLTDSMWIFLYSPDCRRLVLLVPRSTSVTVPLYVVVVLMCSREEASPKSSYSAILIANFLNELKYWQQNSFILKQICISSKVIRKCLLHIGSPVCLWILNSPYSSSSPQV